MATTFLTHLITPALYLILADIKARLGLKAVEAVIEED